nr:retrovirus-related Pol polyprotein from transposon TNT 1-94 [Tanacetum cinerariifolium]
FAKQSIMGNLPKVGESHALSKPVTSNSIPILQESKVMKNDKVIAPGMFRINPFKPYREEKHVPNIVRASVRIKPITVSQPPVITKKVNDRVPSASKSSRRKNKEVEVEEHHRNLLLSKNKKHISSACNNIKLDSQNVISKVVCAMCKQCLISVNHDVCLRNYVNVKTSRGKKQKANVSIKEKQKKHQPKVIQICLWCVDSGCSKHMTNNLKLLINFVWKFMGTVRFGNDHVAVILGFRDLQWGNILTTRVYFVEGLGHNLFSDIQICLWCVDSGCSKHMTKNLKLLINFVWKFMGTVRFGNDHVAAILGFRDLQWGNILTTRVYFVEGLGHNLFSAEAIATACFTQNHSIIHRRFNKTPYELINCRKLDISLIHVFRALCYLKNDREDIGKLGAKATNFPNTSHDVDELNSQQQPAQQQENHAHLQSKTVANNVPNAMLNGNTFVNPFTNPSTSVAESSSLQNAMTDPAWIEPMQEEFLQFKRHDVWVLVPTPDNISPLTLKWLFKNKHDEEQTVIRNKSRLVMRGYR